jgi:hypothetical protein
VLVTWDGNVFCNVSAIDKGGSAANSLIEYYIHLVLTEGANPPRYNEPGSASFGERLNIRAAASNVSSGRDPLACPSI